MALKKPQKSLKKWTKQKWQTKSGKPWTQGSKATGERYLPKAAIKSLSAKEYAATIAKNARTLPQVNNILPNPNALQRKTARSRKA